MRGESWSESIVQRQLRRAARTAAARDVQIDFAKALVDHLAAIGTGSVPRTPRGRRVRSEVDVWLADAFRSGAVAPGETIKLTYDRLQGRVRIDERTGAPVI